MKEELMLKVSKLDWDKWIDNTLLFIRPLAVIYLGSVVVGINADGFQLSDFNPDTVVIGAMVLYVLNVLLDFFKKFKKA